MTAGRRRPAALAAGILALGLLAGCAGQETSVVPPRQVRKGDPQRGAQLIQSYGCGSCHTVPGVPGANALVGPPLDHFAERSYIAGVLPNSAPNLRHWIRDPQGVVPGNAMPNLGVTKQDATDITAYLYTLR
jgi:cytochrome c1